MSREYFANLNRWTVEEYILDGSGGWDYNNTYKFKCEQGFYPMDYVMERLSRWGTPLGEGVFRHDKSYGEDKFRKFGNYSFVETEDEYQSLKCRRLE
jgi:hypothetical protein|tara:strand:- start:488 stop:778 length:291 start_codon:yes stop_codon:yes gene_type:complete